MSDAPINPAEPEPHNLESDSLGFRLNVAITFGVFEKQGQHITYEDAVTKKVSADAIHKIKIHKDLDFNDLTRVIPHEVYHLFYSVRHLITVDEETEAEVFGQLVSHITKLWYEKAPNFQKA